MQGVMTLSGDLKKDMTQMWEVPAVIFPVVNVKELLLPGRC